MEKSEVFHLDNNTGLLKPIRHNSLHLYMFDVFLWVYAVIPSHNVLHEMYEVN